MAFNMPFTPLLMAFNNHVWALDHPSSMLYIELHLALSVALQPMTVAILEIVANFCVNIPVQKNQNSKNIFPSGFNDSIRRLGSLPGEGPSNFAEKMDTEVDHYAVLDLPSGEEGAKLSEKDISKAYKKKALELHPDKRLDDPNAHLNFQKLKTSYEILKDEKARKLFDDLLRVKREKIQRQSHQDSKRRKMMSDLDARERAAFSPDDSVLAREEEERIARKLKEEIARIRAMHSKKVSTAPDPSQKEAHARAKESTEGKGSSVDKEKVLKVSWEKIGEDYTAQKLTELFSEFGEVEDVVIKSSKKKGSALVDMSSKDAAKASCGNVLGDLSNPLLIVPLQPVQPPTPSPFFNAEKYEEPEVTSLSNLIGAGYQKFEDSVLEKMRKAAQRKKLHQVQVLT
ncbi:hypothetical protein RND71_007727 [Anisodus tanguticus]|uniref:Uncharacterized protein n=1 Tax=Anisodus tanguticus TaxID=243964 RepID=A0AAE1SJJ0_9SOLA|nr:hypothetical protein RND71_007727 [Anisodus tanguticus]